jgi:hypothetical protein
MIALPSTRRLDGFNTAARRTGKSRAAHLMHRNKTLE